MVQRNWNTSDKDSSIIFLIAVPLLAVLSYLPFYLQLRTHTGGIGIVHAPSNPVEFLLVNGLFIGIIILFLLKDITRRPYLLLIAIPFVLTGYIAAAIAVIPAIYWQHGLFPGTMLTFPVYLLFSVLRFSSSVNCST